MEKVAPLSGYRLELSQDRERLPAERHQVLLAHFHALGRYAPFRRLQIKLAPLRPAQLPGSHEEQGGELECRHRGRIADVSVNRAQQLAYAGGFGDRGMIALR